MPVCGSNAESAQTDGKPKSKNRRKRMPKKLRVANNLPCETVEIDKISETPSIPNKQEEDASQKRKERPPKSSRQSQPNPNEIEKADVKASSCVKDKENEIKPTVSPKKKKNRHKPHLQKKAKYQDEGEKIVMPKMAPNRKAAGKAFISSGNFPEYYRDEVVCHALAKGVLITGVLRIHSKSFEEAYVSCPDGSEDISIIGIRNRNRALHGDKVAIDILPEKDWRINVERLRDYNLLNTDVENDLAEGKCF